MNKITYAGLIQVLLILFCVREYNPFKDYSNVELVISNETISFGDTVEIFSTQSFSMAVAFSDLVDSLTVTIDNNRLWSDTTIVPSLNTTYPLPFSLYAAGEIQVLFCVFLKNGGIDSSFHYFHAVSPLEPDSVTGFLGSETILSTTGVKDIDVVYTWNFGDVNIVATQKKIDTVIFISPVFGHKGVIKVKEKSGSHISPGVPFYYSFQDTTFPTIVCKNSTISNDTVTTGNNTFTFLVAITDQGGRMVDSASILNNPFTYVDKDRKLYATRFLSLSDYTVSNPLEITVTAIDNIGSEYTSNKTEKTYWLVYDSTVVDEDIILINIAGITDTTTTADTLFYIYGDIWNFSLDTLTLYCALNDSGILPVDTIRPHKSQNWNRLFSLTKKGENTVTLYATKIDNSTVLASESRVIYYDPDIPDTAGPIIAEIIINDSIYVKDNTLTVVADSSVKISVKAYDQVSQITSLLIDNIAAESHPQQLLWIRENVAVPHDPSHKITIYARDDSSHETITSFRCMSNTKPELDIKDSLATSLLYVGKTYYDTIFTYDPDHDPVTVTVLYKGSWSVNGSYLFMKPTPADIGPDSITFHLADNYEKSDTITWNFIVAQDTIESIAFKSSVYSLLPKTLRAEKDTMSFTITPDHVANNPTPEIRYIAAVEPPVDTLLLDTTSTTGGSVTWLPHLEDTGSQTLRLTVKDFLEHSHTIYHPFTVVSDSSSDPVLMVKSILLPENDTTSHTQGDTISLTQDDTVQLCYYILDTLSSVKNYKVTIKQSNFADEFIVNDTMFTHTIYHDTSIAGDYVTVTVTDTVHRQRTSTFTLYIKYLGNGLQRKISGMQDTVLFRKREMIVD